MKIKSKTLIEYNDGVDLNISDSIIFASNEQKFDHDCDKTKYDTMNKVSTSIPLPGIINFTVMSSLSFLPFLSI